MRHDFSNKQIGHYSLLTRQDILKRIRDLNRVLKHKTETLTPENKKKLDEKLELLETILNTRQFSKQYQKKTYQLNQKIRFFEFKKLQKKLYQTRRQLVALSAQTNQEASSHSEHLTRTLNELQTNLLYVKHFPKNRPYISLFLNEKTIPTDVLVVRKKIYDKIQNKICLEKSDTIQPSAENDEAPIDDLFIFQSLSDVQPTNKITTKLFKHTGSPRNEVAEERSTLSASHLFFDEDF